MSRLLRLMLLCASILAAIATTASADVSKLDPLARRALGQVRAGYSAKALANARASTNAARDLDVFIVGPASRAELEMAGARVRTSLPGLCTAYVPESAIERVAALEGVVRIHGAVRVKPLLDVSVPSTGATALRLAGPDFPGLNGDGVLVGIVDTGVDYDHGDFKDALGATRVRTMWDQTDLSGPSPSGFGYGTEWAPAAINSHAARETDDDGHGTHVLGIAAGDGSATGGAVPAFTYVGMAPKAGLVVVKTDFSDTGILDGVAYVMERATAAGLNAVVNLSLGSLYGPKDGTGPFEAGIAALTGPGHIVVAAAGNDGGSPVHAEVIAPGGGSISSTMSVPATVAGDVVALDGYYPAAGALSVKVVSPRGHVIGPVALGSANAAYPGTLTADGEVYVENGLYLTATGDRQVYVEIAVPDPNSTGANMSGTWTFTFVNGSSNSATHDETTEDLTTTGNWNAAAGSAATPKTVAAGVTGAHLLITEIGWRGINSASLGDSTEFIEIYNPTASAVDLSNVYLSDVNNYATLPVAGTVNLLAVNTDFAMKFPAGATIAAGGVKVIAIDGGRYRRGTGSDADFMFFNAGGTTSAVKMTDVGTNKGGGYPGFGSFTNGGEFVWLFSWDGVSDLVCDLDLVYWGSATGGNLPLLKLASTCQDGPDAGTGTTCYAADAGNLAGSMTKSLSSPSSGSGTRQRTGAEGAESGSGNGCPNGSGGGAVPNPVEVDQWIFYDTTVDYAGFVAGAVSDRELVSEPANADQVISVGAWVTKTSWTDCGSRSVSYVDPETVGDLASFSSPGPTRDGRQKPDLAAPGMGIGSSTSFDPGVSCPGVESGLLNDGMQHQVYEGTSMAAPHVAGAVALLLQKYGAMTPAEVKTLLFARALTDAYTGTVWNRRWGNGKLFLGDLTDPVVQVLSPNGGEIFGLAQSATLTWTASDAYGGVTTVDLYLTRDDGATFEPIALAQPNGGSYVWEVTGPTTGLARLKVVAHDAAGNVGVDLSDDVFRIDVVPGVPQAGRVTEYALSIASGNPVRGTARVDFALPHDTRVDLSVYDVTGRSVALLARGPYTAGRHQAAWCGGQGAAASGIYFIRLKATDREIVKRVVLAR